MKMINKSYQKQSNRKKVLISAYSCQPGRGSEPGIGWNWAKQAARFNEVWVLTRAGNNNREVIEAEMQRHPDRALHFSYVDLPRWLSSWHRSEKMIYFYYYLWQIVAYKRGLDLHKEISFDVSHHLTFGNVWLPTFLWRLPVPFIWGPLGGYETIPLPFWKLFSVKWKLFEIIRYIIQFWSRNLDLITRMAGKKSSIIIGRTEETSSLLSKDYPDKVLTISGNGIDKCEIDNVSEKRIYLKNDYDINILMVGRMIHWKGFSIGIQAFQKMTFTNRNAKLHIIGSGPEEENLRHLCFSAGIIENVIFHGQVPRQEVYIYYEQADIFFHPSLKDSACSVIFEAMAVGLPVVCFDLAGPGDVVTESCGIKIPAKNPKQAIEEFAKALIRLAEDKTLRHSLGQGGRERLKDFFWEKQGEFIRKLYLEAART